MNKIFNALVIIILLVLIGGDGAVHSWPDILQPTNLPKSEEGRQSQLKREAWWNLLHQADAGVDWKQIEYENQFAFQEKKLQHISLRNRDCEEFSIAEGAITGTWAERGSRNQAGSVFDTEYDAARDEIWVLSAGGSLWKGARAGNEWQVVNQDLRFSPGILKFIRHQDNRRLIAFINRTPHYSDDDGISWKPASGIRYKDRFGNFKDPVSVRHGKNTFIYTLSVSGVGEQIVLYRSEDKGETYQPVYQLPTAQLHEVSLTVPLFSTSLQLIYKEGQSTSLVQISPQDGSIRRTTTDFDFGEAIANLTGWMQDTTLHLFAYKTELVDDGRDIRVRLYHSEDRGNSWNERGMLFAEPWQVGLYISPSNPDVMYYGEVECFQSIDAGKTWRRINSWQEYYLNIEEKLHADIMNFAEFRTSSGEPFLLVSTHGGLSISYDQFTTQTNLGLQNLNVSQYYSVKTDQKNPEYIYAGSQDQGLQVSDDASEPDALSFNQVLPGDFHHLVLTNNNESIWAVYIGGWVAYFENLQEFPFTTNSFQLDSEDEQVWFPPIIASPFTGENAVLLAGGNIDGGPGSFIIKLEIEDRAILKSQLDFDFKEASNGGVLSALSASPINPELWYAVTTNGHFFYSADAGQTWSCNKDLPLQTQAFYGQAILPSVRDQQTVYLAGSGYSNPPVYVSNDNGVSFQSMSQGLPSTLVLDLELPPDGDFILAATEAGPYIFLPSENRWFSLNNGCAPNQTYWSVEYLPNERTARFGTFGRGIWDFEINRISTNVERSKAPLEVRIYPNPAIGNINFELPQTARTDDSFDLYIFSMDGQLLLQKTGIPVESRNTIGIEELAAGTYLLQVRMGSKAGNRKIVVVRP